MKDLTKGSVFKAILIFTLPMLISNLFQQLYNVADMAVVGKINGSNDLAAIGATGSLSFLIVGFVTGMTSGFSILVARSFGAGDHAEMKKCIAGTVKLGFITAVIMTAVSLSFLKEMLTLMDTPPEIFDDAYKYISIIFAGLMITMLYNMAASVLRAVGDSKTPLYFLIIASLSNIALDVLLIGVCDMGVAGAAYATLIAQGISVVLCYIYIFTKYKDIVPSLADFKVNWKRSFELLKYGFSMGFQSSLVALGSVAVQSSVNAFGPSVIAANTAAKKIDSIFMIPLATIGTAGATFVSQNLGAGQIGRIRDGIKKMFAVACVWSVLAVIVIYLFAGGIIGLVVKKDDPNIAEVIRYGVRYARFNIMFYAPLGALFIYRSGLQGLGNKIVPILSGGIELVIKIGSALLLAPRIGYDGIIVAEPISWVLCCILLMPMFYVNKNLRGRKDG